MILAITQRYDNDDRENHCKETLYLSKYFKDIFKYSIVSSCIYYTIRKGS